MRKYDCGARADGASYSSLKKLIYNLEKQSVAQAGAGALAARDPETAGLLDHEDQYGAPDEQFKAALIKELDRITSFFQAREREVWPEVSQYLADFETARPEMEELLGASVLPSLSASSNARRRRRSLSAATTSGARPTLRNRVSSYSIDSRRRSSITFADDTADPLARTSSAPEGQNDMSHEPAEGSNATDHQNANDNGDGDGDDEDEEDDDDDDDDEDYHSGQRRGRRVSQSELESSGMQYQATMEDMATYEVLISLKKRAVAAFVALSNLNNYIELNYTGFSKALKKFDKTCGFNIRDEFMKSQVAQAHPFRKETSARINDSLEAVVASYAFIATNDDKRAATKDLNMHLREHLVFERNTVWRDMIGIERRQQAARVSATGGSGDLISFKLPLLGSVTLPGWLVSWNSILLIFNLAVFALLLSFGTLAQDEQSNCLALLVFVSLMWATEVGLDCWNQQPFTNSCSGNSALCDITPRSISRRDTPCCQRRDGGEAGRSCSDKAYFLIHVHVDYYALARRILTCGCIEQVPHCQAARYGCVIACGHPATQCVAMQHVCLHVC